MPRLIVLCLVNIHGRIYNVEINYYYWLNAGRHFEWVGFPTIELNVRWVHLVGRDLTFPVLSNSYYLKWGRIVFQDSLIHFGSLVFSIKTVFKWPFQYIYVYERECKGVLFLFKISLNLNGINHLWIRFWSVLKKGFQV